MTAKRPEYRESGQVFFADACAPLEQAAEAGRLRLQALARGQYPGGRLPPRVLPGVRSVGYWDAEAAQDWGLVWHRNEGIELTFVERGSIPFSVAAGDFRLRPDDLTILRPWQPHRLGNPNVAAGRLYWVIVDLGVRRPHQAWQWPDWLVMTESDRRELTRMLRENEQALWHATAEIRQCFQRIGKTVEGPSPLANLPLLTVYLNELFALLLRMFRQGDVPLDESLTSPLRTLELFWDELRGNCEALGQPWTLAEMARRCDLGITRFAQMSRKVTNQSPMQYLSALRVEAACRQLREQPQRSVTQIALDCGFASSQYFARVFRNQTGLSPQTWRVGHDGGAPCIGSR